MKRLFILWMVLAVLLGNHLGAAFKYLDKAAANGGNGTIGTPWNKTEEMYTGAGSHFTNNDTLVIGGPSGGGDYTMDFPDTRGELGLYGFSGITVMINPLTPPGQPAVFNSIRLYGLSNATIDGLLPFSFTPGQYSEGGIQMIKTVGVSGSNGGTYTTNGSAAFLIHSTTTNLTVRGVEIDMNRIIFGINDVGSSNHGLSLGNGTMTNILLEYLYIHDTPGDAVNANYNNVNNPLRANHSYTNLTLQYSAMTRFHDDGFQGGSNTSLLYNLFNGEQVPGLNYAHPDGAQFSKSHSYVWIEGCFFFNAGQQPFGEGLDASCGLVNNVIGNTVPPLTGRNSPGGIKGIQFYSWGAFEPAFGITRTGTTARLTAQDQVMLKNGTVTVEGVTGTDASLYNGTFVITNAVADRSGNGWLEYTMAGTPTANATNGGITFGSYFEGNGLISNNLSFNINNNLASMGGFTASPLSGVLNYDGNIFYNCSTANSNLSSTSLHYEVPGNQWYDFDGNPSGGPVSPDFGAATNANPLLVNITGTYDGVAGTMTYDFHPQAGSPLINLSPDNRSIGITKYADKTTRAAGAQVAGPFPVGTGNFVLKQPVFIGYTPLNGAVDTRIGRSISLGDVNATGIVLVNVMPGTYTMSYTGTLPPGLTWTGYALDGTPTTAGTYSVTLKAHSGATLIAQKDIIIAIQPSGGSPAPAIASALTATGTVSTAFSYKIQAFGRPTSYSASGLPAWASINTSTGVISGTPNAAATTSVTIGANNGTNRTETLVLTIGAGGGDVTAPTLTSATINTAGTTVTLAFSENVTFGAGSNGGWTVSLTGGAATLSYSSGAGTTSLVYNLSRTVPSSESGTCAYTQPGNGVEDTAGNDLATLASAVITNNSTYVPVVVVPVRNRTNAGRPRF